MRLPLHLLAIASLPAADLREGDIVFQTNAGGQAPAIRAATASPVTHCGVVFQENGELMVMEAGHPVGTTTLAEFEKRSVPGSFHAMRLKKQPEGGAIAKAKTWAAAQLGKSYDFRFAWDDQELYCSEFVWKFFHQAGVKLCEPRPFRSYDLDDPKVRELIEQRYGSLDNLPLDEPAVAPGDLAASKLLAPVPD